LPAFRHHQFQPDTRAFALCASCGRPWWLGLRTGGFFTPRPGIPWRARLKRRLPSPAAYSPPPHVFATLARSPLPCAAPLFAYWAHLRCPFGFAGRQVPNHLPAACIIQRTCNRRCAATCGDAWRWSSLRRQSCDLFPRAIYITARARVAAAAVCVPQAGIFRLAALLTLGLPYNGCGFATCDMCRGICGAAFAALDVGRVVPPPTLHPTAGTRAFPRRFAIAPYAAWLPDPLHATFMRRQRTTY